VHPSSVSRCYFRGVRAAALVALFPFSMARPSYSGNVAARLLIYSTTFGRKRTSAAVASVSAVCQPFRRVKLGPPFPQQQQQQLRSAPKPSRIEPYRLSIRFLDSQRNRLTEFSIERNVDFSGTSARISTSRCGLSTRFV